MGDWTFFSNHGHVLVCLARDAEARLRDVAVQVGITERAVQKIVRDLQDEGYLEVSKHGRRNRYRINNRKAMRHPLQTGTTVGQLLKLLEKTPAAREKAAPEPQPKPDPKGDAETRAEPVPEAPPDKAPDPRGSGSERPARDLEQGRLF